jgi:hypothetical protein
VPAQGYDAIPRCNANVCSVYAWFELKLIGHFVSQLLVVHGSSPYGENPKKSIALAMWH